MKGLLYKDLCVLMKQMRAFLLLIAVFAVMPGSSMTGFAVLYAAMMPYTVLAYDERAKWDIYARMMPYSDRDVVLSKYILGWSFIGVASLLALASSLVQTHLLHSAEAASPASVGFLLCMAVLMLAAVMPFMFRFGVEKGRLIFMVLCVALTLCSTMLLGFIADRPGIMRTLMLILPFAAVAASVVSVLIATKLYAKREL